MRKKTPLQQDIITNRVISEIVSSVEVVIRKHNNGLIKKRILTSLKNYCACTDNNNWEKFDEVDIDQE